MELDVSLGEAGDENIFGKDVNVYESAPSIESLKKFVKRRSEQLSELEKRFSILENARIPFKLKIDGNGRFFISSDDYSSAETFLIREDNRSTDGTSAPAWDGSHGDGERGGLNRSATFHYPVFFAYLDKDKKFQVKLSYKSMLKEEYRGSLCTNIDPKIIFFEKRSKEGWGLNRAPKQFYLSPLKIGDVVNFFAEKGVNKQVLDKFAVVAQKDYESCGKRYLSKGYTKFRGDW